MTVLRRLALLPVIVLLAGLLPVPSGTDPALTVLRARLADREPDAAALASVRAELGLDGGPLGLLRQWLAGLAHGDFGRSWVSGEPVGPTVSHALGVSLTLAGFAVVVALLVALLLVGRSLRQGLTGRVVTGNGGTAAFLAALPEFLLAMILLLVFAVRLRLLPTAGWDGVAHAVLPSIALGIPAGAVLGTIAADAVRGVVNEPWVTTWRAAGFPRGRVLPAVGRRAGSVLSGQVALLMAGLLGGAVTVEVVFAVPGLGRLAVAGALAQDVPVVRGCVLAIVLAGVVAGGLGAAGQRLLLGPAFTDGAMAAPPVTTRARSRMPVLVLGAVIGIVTVAGLTRDPRAVDLAARMLPPSPGHPFGTDALGRDLLARIGHGTVATVLLAVAVTAVALAFGLLWGLLLRGSSVVSTMNAVPPTVVALIVAAVAGPGVLGAAIAVAAVLWAPLAAHARSLALEQHAAQYMDSARALGASGPWLLVRHVLPAVVPPVVRNAVIRVPGVALAVASLGFLGLGAQPPSPEWGLLLAEGMSYVERAPWLVAFPVAALASLGVLSAGLAARIR
ncbi:ABC transporter permease subunit [Amycolatopsis orientalis]|uniref:ABC transporter permease subunit n=1 Tax=Amycolatopsis orientalis TaxID=31958 RepID=UPI0003FB98CD|nr:ABC transporter permease subunit [Amycolatopsis orientalis]